MKTKRLMIAVLTVIMLLALFTGCAGDSGTTNPTAAPTDEATKVPDEKTADSEPIKISIGSTSSLQTTPCMWYETDTWQEVLRLANVEIAEYHYYDQDKFNILLAGSDLPDVVFSHYTTKLPDIIEAELALDLKPYYDEYPHLDGEPYKQRNEIISAFYGGKNNALYFLGDYVGLELRDGGVQNWRGYNVRWDWYKEIGAPEVKNQDDYIAVLEEMVKNHPTTEDGKKVYATGIAGSSFGSWYLNGCFSKPAMTNLWTFGSYLYMEAFEDGKLINGYTDLERSPFWSDMRFYNILYNKGLLDPDSFTMTDDERKAKSAAGQYAAEMGWPHADLYNAKKAEDPHTLAGMITIPTEACLVFADYKQVTGFFPSYYIFVSAASKAIDGALSFLNVLHDPEVVRMLYSGFEGVHWNMVDGVPTLTEEVMAAKAAGGDEWTKTGIGQTYNFGFLQGSYLAADGYPVDLFDTDDMRAANLTPLEKDYADYYGVQYPAQACMKYVKEGKTVSMENAFSELNQSATEPIPTDIQRILTQCNDILFEAVPKLVQAKTEEEFKSIQAQVLAELEANNEKVAWEWCLEANTKAKEFTKPIIESLSW